MAEWKPFGTLTDEAREGDWKMLAEAQHKRIERMHGLLREMKAAMLGYPMSCRALTPTNLLHAIRQELGEADSVLQQNSSEAK